MKKFLALLVLFALLLGMASCGAKPAADAPAEPQAPAATEGNDPTAPAPTEPEWEPGMILASYTEGLFTTFDAGTQLKVVGQLLNYYVVEAEPANLLVEKQFVRRDEEAGFDSWNGFTAAGTKVYANPYLRGDVTATLPMNTQVLVLQAGGNWAHIQWDGGEGYIAASDVTKWRRGSGYDGGSGSSGGSQQPPSDGTDVPIGSLTGYDDSSIPQVHLLGAYYGPQMEDPFQEGNGTILADGVEGYICLWTCGEEVKITDYDDTTATVWVEGDLYATIPRWLVGLSTDTAAESWTGYARYNAVLYSDYQLRTEAQKLSVNQEVTVVHKLNDDCYVVEFEGQILYMQPQQVSADKVPTGGGSGGETPAPAPGSTWTPPVL